MNLVNITIDTVEFTVFFNLTNGEPAITHLAPEDCDPGSPAEIEILEVYADFVGYSANASDLIQVLKEEVITEIENKILENR